MLRCLQIAKNGLGTTAPNPMVGCVIVHDSKIIGEGFTSPYGGSHAEVNAINSVEDKSLLKEATLYVSLEPCSHFGKTPPCADLIVANEIPQVIIGLVDPHEKVAGKGIAKLKAAGVSVEYGFLEKECHEHHKRFLTFQEKKRPYIILKWAQTTNGFIAPSKKLRSEKPEPYWITNAHSRQLVHQWRSEEQAILVGTNTVIEDNPKLDVRQWSGTNPIRVVIDRELKIGNNANILDGSIRTIIVTDQKLKVKKREEDSISHIYIDFSQEIATQLTEALYNENINSIFIEGGAKTLQSFIDANLWDEARVFTGQTTFSEGVEAPKFSGRIIDTRKIETDTLNIFHND